MCVRKNDRKGMMKMKKIWIAFLLFYILITLTSCLYEIYWDGDSLDIKAKLKICHNVYKAEIVQVGEFIRDENGTIIGVEETLITSINDLDVFMDDLNRVDASLSSFPQHIKENTVAIKLYCIEGDTRYISSDGISGYTKKDDAFNGADVMVFDKEDFEDLIKKYTLQ